VRKNVSGSPFLRGVSTPNDREDGEEKWRRARGTL